MEPATPIPTVQQLSQELVDLTHDIKSKEQRVAVIKQQIVFDWRGGPIHCAGGKVTLVQASEFSSLNQEMLMQLIFERSLLSKSDADALVSDCKVENRREAYVSVRLEA